jgi:hypothetical protein
MCLHIHSARLRNLAENHGEGCESKNYKKESLLSDVSEILPARLFLWGQVAALCKQKSGEAEFRDKNDVKRRWNEKMCNKNKKPTGKTGAANDFIFCCQIVQQHILKRCESSLMGGEVSGGSDSGSGSEEADSRNMAWLNEEGKKEQVDGDDVDVDVPNLPPIEDAQFEAEIENPEKDNDEAKSLNEDEANRCVDSVGKVI